MNTIAWTGHRPKDLQYFSYGQFAGILDHLGMPERDNVQFVTGGALGIDTYAAEYALANHIPLHIILPFAAETMGRLWTPFAQKTLAHHIEAAASHTVIGNDAYDITMYQRRNEAMVDRAENVFTVWTGKKQGGTANCIRYALKTQKPVFNLLPADGRLHRVRSA